METVTVQPNLMEDIRNMAKQQSVAPEEIVSNALHYYMRAVQRQKILEEIQAFQSLHAELVKHYLGQVVAIHKGQVVDHDEDFVVLHQRVRQNFGRTAVLIRRVETESERVLAFRSPYIER